MTTTPNDAPIARALHALAPHAAARVPDDLAERAATAALSAKDDTRGLLFALVDVLRPVAALSAVAAVVAFLLTGGPVETDTDADPIAALVDARLGVDDLVSARFARTDATEHAP